MVVTLLNTRQFLELTPWTERQLYQERHKHSQRFPQPVARDKTGNLYSAEDVLSFATSIIEERKAELIAELDVLSLRINAELNTLEEKSAAIICVAQGLGEA